MVHNKVNPNKQDFIQELYEDLLPIATVFIARNNGLRAGWNRKRRRELKENQELGESQAKKIKNKKKNKKKTGRKMLQDLVVPPMNHRG